METKNKRKILLVEDEIVTTIYEKRLLESYNYEVITASTGEKAITIIKENYTIELILMDINLGSGIDGIEATQEILKERNIPVLFLSGHIEPEIIEKTEQVTSYGYVVKNSGITILDASIKMAFKLFEANKKTMEKEERYRFLVENLRDAVFTLDKQGIITYVSPQIKNISSYKIEEVIGKNFIEFVHSEDVPMLLERYTLFLNGLEEPWKFRVLNKDSSTKNVTTVSKKINKNGDTVGAIVLMIVN